MTHVIRLKEWKKRLNQDSEEDLVAIKAKKYKDKLTRA